MGNCGRCGVGVQRPLATGPRGIGSASHGWPGPFIVRIASWAGARTGPGGLAGAQPSHAVCCAVCCALSCAVQEYGAGALARKHSSFFAMMMAEVAGRAATSAIMCCAVLCCAML